MTAPRQEIPWIVATTPLPLRDAVAAGSADHSYFLPEAQVPFGDPQLEPPYGDRKFDQ